MTRLAVWLILLAGVLTMSVAQGGPVQNLCLNPGFEKLNPAGDNFPVDWGNPNGTLIDKDAHGGAIALRLTAPVGKTAGVTGAPIEIRHGEVSFWYKAVKSGADGSNLQLCVIALNRDGIEAGRVGYPVPKEHVGDGQWHQGRLEFDFTSNLAAVKVLLAPRINETPAGANTEKEGEWLIDDIECVAKSIGQRAEIETFYQPEPIMMKGRANELFLQVANTGDAPVPPSRLRLRLPEGVTVQAGGLPAEIGMEALAPEQVRRFTWQLVGASVGEKEITIQWSAADFKEGTIVSRSRKTVCIDRGTDPRALCTGYEGYWRFMPAATALQTGNDAPLKKLKTKKSVDLPDSMIGITAHVPREKDFESIFEPEYLNDGNHETNWSGHAYYSAVPGPVDWAQVDFKGAREINEIRLVPFWHAIGFPVDFTVKLKQGRQWVTAYTGQRVHIPVEHGEPGKKVPYVIKLDKSLKGSAVRVEVTRYSPSGSFFTEFKATNSFRLSEIEAIDLAGQNVALASNGGKATACWSFRSWYNSPQATRETYKELYNIGAKWNRIGQWGDWTCWAAVEREKGKYTMDPATDRGITDSVKNGVNILYTLDYGNALYEKTPDLADIGPTWRHGHPFTGDGGPTTPEAIQGFVNYARFCGEHFKGRVKYWELWNEENSWVWYGAPPSPKAFGTLIRETAKALKEIDPENKVMVGGTAALAPTFISEALEQGGGPYIDAIAFHPYGMPQAELGLGTLDVVESKQKGFTPEQLGYKTYEEMLAFLHKTFDRFNPNLVFWADEWNAIPDRENGVNFHTGEPAEAKQAARFFTMATLTGVRGVWWSLANQNDQLDWAVLRMADNSRKPIFYTIQALSTMLAGAKPDAGIKATLTGDTPEPMVRPLRGRDGETLVAVWSATKPEDDYTGKRASLRIEGAAGKQVDAVDTLHAVTQTLTARQDGAALVIDNLLVMDYPVIVRVR